MKKILLPIVILLTLNCFSQAITVNTTSYSVPQLVNSVLINSSCVSATNITSRTGTDFGSTNGIGYFQNTNPNFPMRSGVVLSTGKAVSAAGPNTTFLGDGDDKWLGDADLENAMAASRISMHSVNATVLEFDFTPISPEFSFDFLFASEEYGNYQCQFSDAFAFLLTNKITGITTNLAVVPRTNLPISVVTIRDFLYNSSCPSENADFFGSYNGGSYAPISATNFNGQTKVINASATLVPKTPYHIKLVIADRGDSNSDSAIFLSSNSFNIGQNVLGQDSTVASNTAVCFGESYVLNSNLSASEYTLSWKKDGVSIPLTDGLSSIIITKPGIYSVTYKSLTSGCQEVTDSKRVEYYPEIYTPTPNNLFKCDSGLTSYQYDLSLNTAVIKAGVNSQAQISYYASSADAKNAVNALPTNYLGTVGQTVHVRIQNPNGCYIVKCFKLLTNSPPVANKPFDLTLCSLSETSNTSVFNLSQQNGAILNGQANNTVTYYSSSSNANSGLNPINSSSYTAANDTTVYARVQNSFDNSCYSITSFKLYVKRMPPVDSLNSVEVCDSYTLPVLVNGNYFTKSNGTGTKLFAGNVITNSQTIYIFSQPDGAGGCLSQSSFTVTIIDPLKIVPKSGTYCGSYSLPPLTIGHYYTEPGGIGTQLAVGTVIKSTQVIYFYNKTTTLPSCIIDKDFKVTIIPILNVETLPNVFRCISYTLPPLTVGSYFTESNGKGTQLTEGTVITTSQKIYIFSTSGAPNNCTSESSFEIYIGITQPADVFQCSSYMLPSLPFGNYYTGPSGTGTLIHGGTVLTDSKVVYIYSPTNAGEENCTDNLHFVVQIGHPLIDNLPNVETCSYYILPSLTNGNYYTGTNGTGTQLVAGDKISTTQTIYIYSSNVVCNKQSAFTVKIYPKPIIESRSDIDICNFYVLTPLTLGNYYTGPEGTGTLLPAGSIIRSSQLIYIYVPSAGGGAACSGETSFYIHVHSVAADEPESVVACDSYVLPALSIGNYYSQSGGAIGGGVLMHAGDEIKSTQTIYVYTESGERINCTDENKFVVTINKTPVVNSILDINTCNSYTLPHLSVGNYFTNTNGTGTMLHEGDEIKSTQTIYVYAQTATSPNCTDEKNFKVTLFNVDDMSDVTICENYTLPSLQIGNYYTAPLGKGVKLYAGQVINASQTIYIYAVSPFSPSCYDESKFRVTIIDTPVANPAPTSLTTVCDEDGNNDGVTVFDLTHLNATILGLQIAPEFEIEYFANQIDAVTKVNPITSTDLKTVFVRVSNNLATSCYDIKSISITVLGLPTPTPKGGIICYDSKTKTLLNAFTIISGLTDSTNTFKWLDKTGNIVGTGNTYRAILPGTYTLIATSKITGCSSLPISVEVSPSEPASISYTITDDFSENQIITVEAVGVGGDYEYQLDFGPFQDGSVFENVSTGNHTITVRDKNGCGNSVSQALVVNYPKFFTPNDDGINDTWNVKALEAQSKSRIYIFDRHGKFIRELKPSGLGWDGTLDGQNLPSDDYWFTISYIEDGISKEFKSHFTLKR